MLPFAIQAGLTPLAAAMAMNLFGHGIALSYDVVVQGAPAISASAAGIPASQILTQGRPVFWVMGIATTVSAFLLNRKTMSFSLAGNATRKSREYQSASSFSPSGPLSRPAKILAVATPLAFFADIAAMLVFDLRGGDATSIVSGTAVLLMCLGAVLASPKDSLEKITGYLTDGFLFAIRIFAPVIAIGAFFFLGGEGISTIMGDSFSGGIMNDWAVWLASHAPLNKYFTAAIQMIVGALTGLDGSGFSGLPLTGALANTFGTAVGASVPVLAALGQITAIFVGGGTLVPWGLIPVAAICNVSPLELARKNFLPVLIGFACTFVVVCLLL